MAAVDPDLVTRGFQGGVWYEYCKLSWGAIFLGLWSLLIFFCSLGKGYSDLRRASKTRKVAIRARFVGQVRKKWRTRGGRIYSSSRLTASAILLRDASGIVGEFLYRAQKQWNILGRMFHGDQSSDITDVTDDGEKL